MIILLNTFVALILLLIGDVSSQALILNIRDNGKICTKWVSPVNGQFQLSYQQQPECVTAVAFEQLNGQGRLCCQGMATTTSATNFPKQCGKQHYEPLKARIIGGLIARANSWVSVLQSLNKKKISINFIILISFLFLSHGKSCYVELVVCVVVLLLMNVMF